MPRYVSRAKRLEKALLALSDNDVKRCKEDVETLLAEMESWRDKLDGTNFEATEKFEDIEECIAQLEEGLAYLEEIIDANWFSELKNIIENKKPRVLVSAAYKLLKGLAEDALSNVEFPGMY